MDMKKILQAFDGASSSKKPAEGSNDIRKFMQIVEGKGPLNRLTAAESIAVNHYTTQNKNITSPVLNVAADAKPSMIGKYFKTVEEEFKESQDRYKDRAKQLAEKVIGRMNVEEQDVLTRRVTPNADGTVSGGFKPSGTPKTWDQMSPDEQQQLRARQQADRDAADQAASQFKQDKAAAAQYDTATKTLTYNGKQYKQGDLSKPGPGTGIIVNVPPMAFGSRSMGLVKAELGNDGMYYRAAKTESVEEDQNQNLAIIKSLIDKTAIQNFQNLEKRTGPSQRKNYMMQSVKDLNMWEDPLSIIKYALNTGSTPEEILAALPTGTDLSKAPKLGTMSQQNLDLLKK